MQDVVIAPSEADARAAEAVVQHHAQMSGALVAQVEQLVDAVSRSDAEAADHRRRQLAAWCAEELMPHALAEEQALYPAARRTEAGRLLVDGMIAEHDVIGDLVRDLAVATDPVRAAATAQSLLVLFGVHLAKENDLVVPLLLGTPGVSVAELLGGMHELLGADDHGHGAGEEGEAAGGCGGHTCGCGEKDPEGLPELDARTIPHAIRHATIFGALETVRPGSGLILVAPHDPLPLLAQIGDRWPGAFAIDYLESGPEAWRLTLVRSA